MAYAEECDGEELTRAENVTILFNVVDGTKWSGSLQKMCTFSSDVESSESIRERVHAMVDELLPVIRKRHGRKIRRVQNAIDLDDVVGATHLRIEEALRGGLFDFRSHEEVEHYILQAAKHAVIDAIRREFRQRQRQQDAAKLPNHRRTLDSVPDDHEEAEAILSKLTKEEASVLLRIASGESHEEIAKALGVTIDCFRSRLRRLKQRLRAMVAERGGVTAGSD